MTQIDAVVGEGHHAGAMEASREIEEQLGIKNRKDDKDHKSKDKVRDENGIGEGALILCEDGWLRPHFSTADLLF